MQAIILRCPPGQTQRLANEFKTQAPIWIPTLTVYQRLPRKRKRVMRTVAAIPGYLFLREDGMTRSLLAALSRKGCSPLWAQDGIARCDMRELLTMKDHIDASRSGWLQDQEDNKVPIYRAGDLVKITKGPLERQIGRVVSQKDQDVTLDLGGFWGRLKISAFLLAHIGAIGEERARQARRELGEHRVGVMDGRPPRQTAPSEGQSAGMVK